MAFFNGLHCVLLDEFLNVWDEQYHALVAKHLSKNFLTPRLLDNSYLNCQYGQGWVNNTIWFHKQPLFLWQMAISIKLIGNTEFAVRFPSLIMFVLTSIVHYKITLLLFKRQIAFFSTLLFSYSYFILDYLTGFYPSDHNDVAFLFYLYLSIYLFQKYLTKQKLSMALLIGFAVGLAVLCKWLIGLFIFLPWLLHLIINKRIDRISGIRHFFISLIFSAVVFSPWQLYGIIKYKTEYLNSMKSNTDHIFQCLEGHCGDYFFYYQALHEQFGQGVLIPIIFILSVVILIIFSKSISIRLLFISLFVSFYTFFTLIKTKMLGYVIILVPFYWTSLVFIIQLFTKKITDKSSQIVKLRLLDLLILLLPLFALNYGTMNKHHGLIEKGRIYANKRRIEEKNFFRRLTVKEKNTLIFSTRFSYNGHIAAMFYSDYQVYNYVPDKEQLKELKKNNIKYLILK